MTDWRLIFNYLLQKVLGVVASLLAIGVYFLLFIWVSVLTITSVVFGSGGRAWKLAVAQDQLGNASIGGHEDETFSSRCYRERHKTKYKIMMDILDWVFLKVSGEENHCLNAYIHEVDLKTRNGRDKIDLLY